MKSTYHPTLKEDKSYVGEMCAHSRRLVVDLYKEEFIILQQNHVKFEGPFEQQTFSQPFFLQPLFLYILMIIMW